jgi:hypothetical protein
MPLSELSSPEAVLAAIKEFDDLGREAFLKKYSFGPAQRFFLEHDKGRRQGGAPSVVALRAPSFSSSAIASSYAFP